jgi:hypothetical protein
MLWDVERITVAVIIQRNIPHELSSMELEPIPGCRKSGNFTLGQRSVA